MLSGVWLLSIRHAMAHRSVTSILVLCIAVPLLIPPGTRLLIRAYERGLSTRSDSTPLVAGAKGNRFDLTLAALYFREASLDPVPMRTVEAMRSSRLGVIVPLHLRASVRGRTLVGTTPEYYEQRGLRAASGTLPAMLGECVLGASAARSMGLAPGGTVFTDPRDVYNIAKPAALRLRVVGVLAPAGNPDDEGVFTDIATAWITDGLVHGHASPEALDPSLVLGATERHAVISEALIEINEVTPETAASFHAHGDAGSLPVSAVLAFTPDARSTTLLKAQVNARGDVQMVVPRDVIDDLMSIVFRVRSLFDGLVGVLAASTVLLTGLVVLLQVRLRRREMETLNRIGCARATVVRLYLAELALVVAASVLVAGVSLAVVWVVVSAAGDLTRMV